MSVKIFTLLLIFLVSIFTFTQKQTESKSGFSSVKLEKLNERTPATHIHSKLSSPFSVEISPLTNEDIKPGDVIELIAKVTSRQNSSNAEMEWVMFKGFEHVSGNLKFTEFQINSNQAYEYRILLRKISRDESVVHFSITTEQNGVRIGAGSSFTSNDLGLKSVDKLMKANEHSFLNQQKHKKIMQ